MYSPEGLKDSPFNKLFADLGEKLKFQVSEKATYNLGRCYLEFSVSFIPHPRRNLELHSKTLLS